MKRYFLSLLIIIFIFSNAIAQERNIRLAERALEKGKLMKAKRRIDKATEHRKTQDNPKAWLLKGEIYSTLTLDSGNYPSVESPLQMAIHAFEEAKKLTSADDLLNLFARQNLETFYHRMMEQAIAMADNGRYEDVWKLLAKAKRILPQAPEAYLFGGQLAFALQDFERAKDSYDDLIRQVQYREEGLYEILNNLIAIYLLEYPTIDSSLAYIRMSQHLLPDSLGFYKKEISLLINSGNLEQAVNRVSSENFPDRIKPLLFTEIAKAYQQNNQSQQAIEQYENALTHHPDDLHLLFNLAENHRQLAEEKALQANEAEYQEAAKHYRSALQYLKKAAEQTNQKNFATEETIQAIELKLEKLTTAQN